MKKNELTQKKLKELLHYDSETGVFMWLERPLSMFSHCKFPERQRNTWNTKNSKNPAGSKHKCKNTYYRLIDISLDRKRKSYSAHRLAFLYTNGEFPKYVVDHIDGNGLNNSWSNLRDVSHQDNTKNSSISISNTSGSTGVSRKGKKWRARIHVNGKEIHGGYFDNIEDAIQKRQEMNIEYKYHKNHGRKR